LGPAYGREQPAAPDWPWQSTDVPASEGLGLLRFDTANLTAPIASKKMNYGTNIATRQIDEPKRHIGGETLCPKVVCFQTMK
jgi:hypothetical protein